MQNPKIYHQTDEEQIEDLIRSSPMAQFQTFGAQGPLNGVFNPIRDPEGRFWLHLNRADRQIAVLKDSPEARLIFFDFLTHIPSHWLDAHDGGVATSYYRYAEFVCQARVIEDADELRKRLGGFLAHYQPSGGHDPMESDVYTSAIRILALVELTPTRRVTKWKMGQNRPAEKRREIAARLRERGDVRAANEIEKWLAKTITA